MLHKIKLLINESADGDAIYILFVNDIGYIRTRSKWNRKPQNISRNVDYYNYLVEKARKSHMKD